jgi:hypothetical protein
MNAKSSLYALNGSMPNIAVQNASEKTGLVTKAGVSNIVLLTLLSLSYVGYFGVILLELASRMISHHNIYIYYKVKTRLSFALLLHFSIRRAPKIHGDENDENEKQRHQVDAEKCVLRLEVTGVDVLITRRIGGRGQKSKVRYVDLTTLDIKDWGLLGCW